MFVHKESYFKPRTDPSINSNDIESLSIEIQHKNDKSILFSVIYRLPNVGSISKVLQKLAFPQMIKYQKTFLLVIWLLTS